MKAYLYDLTITDSASDMIHGFSRSIKEVYVPRYKMVANLAGQSGEMYVFIDDDNRMKGGTNVKEIEIPSELARDLRATIRRSSLSKRLKKVLDKSEKGKYVTIYSVNT